VPVTAAMPLFTSAKRWLAPALNYDPAAQRAEWMTGKGYRWLIGH